MLERLPAHKAILTIGLLELGGAVFNAFVAFAEMSTSEGGVVLRSSIKRKRSDFTNIKDSGSCCVGCGRSSQIVRLMRLRTYSRSLCCGACFINPEYAKCANENSLGHKCNHEPHPKGLCQHCGCPAWRHGLERELDKQLAAGIGVSPRVEYCAGFGVNLGKCGRMILAGPDGTISKLCVQCERNWVNEVKQGQKEVGALLNLDITKAVPQ